MKDKVAATTLLARTSRLYKMKVNAVLVAKNIDLSSEMCGMLLELGDADGKNQQELADILFKDKGGITKILKSLAKRDLIYAKENKKDKRCKNIFLSPQGKKTLQIVRPLINEFRILTLTGIAEEHLEEAKEVMLQIIHNLTETPDL